MTKNRLIREGAALVVAACLTQACQSHYSLYQVTAQRVEMTNSFDRHPNSEVLSIITPYKHSVDSTMNSVIGVSDVQMTPGQPESLLTDFVADLLYDEARDIDPAVDFAVINVGGMRANMPKGNVTTGNIFEIAPFENILTILSMKGSDVKQLMVNIADFKGQGVSRQVRMLIGPEGLKSVSLDGKEIDENKVYKVATLDYLAEGNDKLTAFKQAIKVEMPGNTAIRDLIISHIK